MVILDKKVETIMNNSSKNSKEGVSCLEKDQFDYIFGQYEEDILMMEIDPIEYLKGPNSQDFGTVFEYYREERRRKRERAQKIQTLKNRIGIFLKMILKNSSKLTK